MTMDSSLLSFQALANKNILVCISGGIAAYKCADLVRRLVVVGAEVRVVMTEAAQAFVTPLTLQALSGNPVHTSLLDPRAEAGMGHIELARWADLVLVAPATANTLAKLAAGQADDLVNTLCLATRAPIVLAPAMNQVMWGSTVTQQNIAVLRERGLNIVGPGVGEQACGDIGAGRMLDVEPLLAAVAANFETGVLAGKKVLITAGPTREALDPVRYLSNRSSGKMGYALAEAAVESGACVTLVSGPVQLSVPAHLTFISVESAQQMYDAVLGVASTADVVIAAAAVADYRPAQVMADKIKKEKGDKTQLVLTKNPDIVAAVAALDGKRFVMGFAAETQSLEAYATDKLERKGLDAIVANDVSRRDIGFDSDSNAVQLFTKDGCFVHYDKRSKSQLARDLMAWIATQLPAAL